jgi:nitric oxide reductase subunit C
VVLVAFLVAVGALWQFARHAAPEIDALEGLGGSGSEAETRSGASLFVVEGCGTCHVTVGPSTALQPSLAGTRAHAEDRIESPDYGGLATTPEEYIRESILDHCADVLPGYSCESAPDVGVRLGSDEIDALVEFIMGLD